MTNALGPSERVARRTAELLAEGKLVGWVQGRAELGPRALGNRSILADPRSADVKARLNERVKFREEFRPFAPALPVEDLPAWFWPERANGGCSPFMGFTYNVQPLQDERIPSACHVDRTAQVQTVDAATQPAFHALLKAFGRRTGVPLLLNTAFSVRGEPLVCSPQDALVTFRNAPLDAMAIGSFLVEKPVATALRPTLPQHAGA
jgi:carbamoyltransferase